jgi:hypothetical protein
VLPCTGDTCGHIPIHTEGVLDHKKRRQRGFMTVEDLGKAVSNVKPGYIVNQRAAIVLLEKRNKQAAAWWREQGYPEGDNNFVFDLKCAEVIEHFSAAEIKKIVQCGDMETGQTRIPH